MKKLMIYALSMGLLLSGGTLLEAGLKKQIKKGEAGKIKKIAEKQKEKEKFQDKEANFKKKHGMNPVAYGISKGSDKEAIQELAEQGYTVDPEDINNAIRATSATGNLRREGSVQYYLYKFTYEDTVIEKLVTAMKYQKKNLADDTLGVALQEIAERRDEDYPKDRSDDFIEYLMDQGAQPTVGNLNLALEKNRSDDLIGKLLDKVDDPTLDTLNLAAQANYDIKIMNMIMDKNVDPTFTTFKNAITRDWQNIKYDVVAALVDAGALESNPNNVKLANGALANDQLIGTLFSADRTVDVNPNLLVEANGHDLLWHAVNKNDLWMVCYLIGYDVNAIQEKTDTEYAFNTVPSLGRIIAPVDQLPNFKNLTQTMSVTKKYPGNDRGKTALMIAFYYSQSGANRKYLSQVAKDTWGTTSDKPGEAVNHKIIKALLDTFIATPNVDLNMKDNDGHTTLWWAENCPPGGWLNEQFPASAGTFPGDFAQTLRDAAGATPQ